jgi:hypothetical protein
VARSLSRSAAIASNPRAKATQRGQTVDPQRIELDRLALPGGHRGPPTTASIHVNARPGAPWVSRPSRSIRIP